MTDHRPTHLSPSRLSTYDRCPRIYKDRYILKLTEPPSFEREFGTAVHAGLEAHYRGLDYEMAYLLSWRQALKTCRAGDVQVPNWLTARGLELIDMTLNLGLNGEPEHRIGIIVAGISIPIIGYADLWGNGVIYDFKTAGWPWTQDKADREMFQPALYSQAYAESHKGQYPTFTFVVLPRNGGGIVQFDGTRNTRQIFETLERAREIHRAIENQIFDCLCGKHEEKAA
jgi:hypothetical protein